MHHFLRQWRTAGRFRALAHMWTNAWHKEKSGTHLRKFGKQRVKIFSASTNLIIYVRSVNRWFFMNKWHEWMPVFLGRAGQVRHYWHKCAHGAQLKFWRNGEKGLAHLWKGVGPTIIVQILEHGTKPQTFWDNGASPIEKKRNIALKLKNLCQTTIQERFR